MAKKTKGTDAENAEDTPAKGGKKKMIVIIAAVAVVGGGAYYYGSSKAPTITVVEATTTLAPALAAGPVVDLPSVNLNLADGHYLRIGVSLGLKPEATADEAKNLNTTVAKDLVVSTFSGRTIDDLSSQSGREHAKEDLAKAIEEAYGEMVKGVYLTDFVTE